MKKDIIPYQRQKELARLKQDEIIEGKLVEDKSIVPAGRGSGFRSELAQAARETDPFTGYPITPTSQHYLDAVDARIAQREEEERLEKQQQANKKPSRRLSAPNQPQLPAPKKTGWLAGLFSGSKKEYHGTLRLPGGDTVEYHSKEEEAALIKRHWG